jgi:hypothetical protein
MGRFEERVFEFGAFSAHFPETSGMNDDEFYALLTALFDHLRNKYALYGDAADIDRSRNVQDAFICLESQHFSLFGVDRVYLPFKFIGLQVFHNDMADGKGIVGCSHHSDGAGSK